MRNIYCINNISKCGTDLFTEEYTLTDSIEKAQGVLVRSASMHEMELPEGLLAVARAGAGVNNIPLEKCAQKGIVVFNTPGANANGVKELVLAGLFLASRDVVGGINWCQGIKDDPAIAKTVEKGKKDFAGCEIKGKKLGVIGLGAIGAEVANAAAALGMDAVLLTRNSCDPLNRRAVRVSMGTVFLVPWTWMDGPLDTLGELGFRTAAMALTDNSISIDNPVLKTEPRLAIVMGTEGDGLSHEAIVGADYVVRIPMAHGVDSLNVAAAAAVAFWQLRV